MIPWALALGLVALSAQAAQAIDVLPAPYRAAAAAGAVGSVTGRVYEERRKPDGPDQPLAGAAVTLLPRSAQFLEKLEAVRRTSRNSMNDFRTAAPAIQTLKAEYEKELWESGAVDLVLGTVVAPDGRFSVENLPAGDWVLFVTSSVATDKKVVQGKTATKERGVYVPGTHLTGYQRLTVWLREITVSGGRAENVELIVRGAWFSGVVEERAPDAVR
jgi:hypothetical protein